MMHKEEIIFSGCEVPTAVLLKIQVLWNLTLCWLVNGYALKALQSYKILLTIYWLTKCNFPEDLHLQVKFFNAWVKMRTCSFMMHEQMQSSSDRWHLSMLAVTQTTTPVMKCTFRNFMVFESVMLNNSSPFYPSNKNAFKSLRPSSMD
jgi:hypothetical protein